MMNIQQKPLGIADSNVCPWQEYFYSILISGNSLMACYALIELYIGCLIIRS